MQINPLESTKNTTSVCLNRLVGATSVTNMPVDHVYLLGCVLSAHAHNWPCFAAVESQILNQCRCCVWDT